MDNNKKTNLLIFSLVIIIVLLSGLLIYTLTSNKNNENNTNNTNNNSNTTTKKENKDKETRKDLITTDSLGNEYYIVTKNIKSEDEEPGHSILTIVSTKDKKNYQDILDLTFVLYSVYTDAPYEGYKIEDGNLYYVNSDGDNEQFGCGEEVKVTLNNNKYTLNKTGNTYKDGAGERCN